MKKITLLSVVAAASTCTLLAVVAQDTPQSHQVLEAPATPPQLVRAKSGPDKAWTQYATRTVKSLPGFAPQKVELDQYGGWKNPALKQRASGFFRTEFVTQNQKSRWWLIDPEGNPFLHLAVVAVGPGGTPAAKESFAQKFAGDKAKWGESAVSLLKTNGFNGTGAWSDVEWSRTKPQFVYTRIWNFMSEYGKKRGGTFQATGHTGYQDNLIFAFDPEFPAFCDEYAARLALDKDDPWLLGHFSDNELPFNLSSLDSALKRAADDHTGRVARAFLKQSRANDSIANLTDEERAGFLNLMADKYFEITTKAIRKYDPNHLCLGSRLHGGDVKRGSVWRAAGKHLDAVAMNYYGQWTPQKSHMDDWARWSQKPFLITEWYVKGADVAGLKNSSGAGWIVPTQEDRGLFYQNFALGLLEHPSCVGFHWFKYMDNDPRDLKAEPSNRDSNKGIVSTSYEPYAPLLSRMSDLNLQAYPLTQYFDRTRSE